MINCLFDNKYKSASWLSGNLARNLIAVGDEPILLGCELILGRISIGKHLYTVLSAIDKAQVNIKSLLGVGTVYAGYIPSCAATTCQYNTLAWITANIAGFIPNGRELTEEILHLLRLNKIAFWFISQMLQRALVEYGQRQFVSITGDVRMLRMLKVQGV